LVFHRQGDPATPNSEIEMSPDGAHTVFRSGDAIPIENIVEAHRGLVNSTRPVALRLRIAKGLLPAAIEDLVPTLAFLYHDEEAEVRRAARDTLRTMPPDQIEPVVKELSDRWVIDTMARVLPLDSSLLPELAVNRHTDDATLVHLAGSGNRATCDVIGRNARRALEHTAIIEALFFNPRATQGTVQALIELAVRENVDLDHMPGFRETKAAILGERGARDDSGDTGLDDIEFLSAMEFAFDDNFDDKGEEGEAEEEDGRRLNLQTMLLSMSVAQKIRLALVGDANARKLLVRDPKKMVSSSVLKSPRITDGEIRSYAGKKELSEDVIATIARNRAWTRDYGVRKALIYNPKCPQSMALSFLRSMVDSDVKTISKHRDVPGVVSRAAKRILEKKAEARNRRRKK